MDLAELGASFHVQRMLRIEAEEGLIERLSLAEIAEVALVNFGFGEQRAEAVTAGGILMAEEFILADGVVEGLFILEDAAFLSQKIGNGGDGGVGLRRAGIAVVDGAIGIEHVLVLKAGALLLGTTFEGFAEALGVGEG
jgi:hypothetical protein